MARVLLVSHSPAVATGYGRVVRQVAAALRKTGHDVSAVGAGGDGRASAFPIFSAATIDDLVPAMRRRLDADRPDVVVTIGDPWMFEELPSICWETGVRWAALFPVDATPLSSFFVNWAKAADATATFSRWSQQAVREATGIEPTYLPHGVDRSVFRPIEKAVAKRRVGVAGRFVVGCVAANQPRKNLPALIDAFARFARDKPDTILYLHSRVAGHWDLQSLAEAAGVIGQTRATLNYDPVTGLDDPTLATIYNAFDVFALPTMAEGFGLPILESQACGVPVVATDCSACTELLPDPVNRVPGRQQIVIDGAEHTLIDVAELATRLENLYADTALRQRLKVRGQALAAGLGWNDALADLEGVIKKACGAAVRSRS